MNALSSVYVHVRATSTTAAGLLRRPRPAKRVKPWAALIVGVIVIPIAIRISVMMTLHYFFNQKATFF